MWALRQGQGAGSMNVRILTEVLLVAESVRAALEDADLVVQARDVMTVGSTEPGNDEVSNAIEPSAIAAKRGRCSASRCSAPTYTTQGTVASGKS